MERKIYITKIKSYVHVIRFEYSVIDSFLVFYKTVEIIFKSHSAQCQLIWGIRVQQCGRSPKFPIPGRNTKFGERSVSASLCWTRLCCAVHIGETIIELLCGEMFNLHFLCAHIGFKIYIYLFDSHGTIILYIVEFDIIKKKKYKN